MPTTGVANAEVALADGREGAADVVRRGLAAGIAATACVRVCGDKCLAGSPSRRARAAGYIHSDRGTPRSSASRCEKAR